MTGSDQEELSVPVPEDRTVSGEKRTQGLTDQAFMLSAAAVLISLGLSTSIGYVGVLLGGIAAGVAFERAQWMIHGRYGSYREAARAAYRKVRQDGGGDDGRS